MNSKDFSEMIKGGKHPVVTFTKGIEEHESAIEPGMRGRIYGIKEDRHDKDAIIAMIDLSEFEDFNRPFEAHTYYDHKGTGEPTLTAREAGFYHVQETIWLTPNVEIAEFEIESDENMAVFQQYLHSGSHRTYIQWLEDQVIAMVKK